jgi:hypothetical protein
MSVRPAVRFMSLASSDLHTMDVVLRHRTALMKPNGSSRSMENLSSCQSTSLGLSGTKGFTRLKRLRRNDESDRIALN